MTTKLIGLRELSSLSCGLLALIFALHLRDVPGWRMPPLLLGSFPLGLPLIYLIHSLLHKSISLLLSHVLNVSFLPSRIGLLRLCPFGLLRHHQQILLRLVRELCFKLSSFFGFAQLLQVSVTELWRLVRCWSFRLWLPALSSLPHDFVHFLAHGSPRRGFLLAGWLFGRWEVRMFHCVCLIIRVWRHVIVLDCIFVWEVLGLLWMRGRGAFR